MMMRDADRYGVQYAALNATAPIASSLLFLLSPPLNAIVRRLPEPQPRLLFMFSECSEARCQPLSELSPYRRNTA
jgi:hypothetical protein